MPDIFDAVAEETAVEPTRDIFDEISDEQVTQVASGNSPASVATAEASDIFDEVSNETQVSLPAPAALIVNAGEGEDVGLAAREFGIRPGDVFLNAGARGRPQPTLDFYQLTPEGSTKQISQQDYDRLLPESPTVKLLQSKVSIEPFKEPKDQKDNKIGRVENIQNSVMQGAIGTAADALSGAGTADMLLGIGPREMAEGRQQMGKELRQWTEDVFKTNPALRDEWISSKIPQSIGSSIPFLATGPLGRVAGPATSAFIGALGMGQTEFEAAKRAGADKGQQAQAFGIGFLGGATEAFGLGRTGAGIRSGMIREIGEEMAQEDIQGIISLLAKANYEPRDETDRQRQKKMADQAESMIIAGISAGLIKTPAAMHEAAARDRDQKDAEAQQSESVPVRPDNVQFTEQGTITIDGEEHAIQDGVLKPVTPESTKGKAIRSLVGEPQEIATEEATIEPEVSETPEVETVTQEDEIPVTEVVEESVTEEGPRPIEEPSLPATEEPVVVEEEVPQASSTVETPVESTVPPSPEATTEPGKDPTSIKNAVVDQERQKRGLPPAMQAARKEFGTTWDNAMARVSRDPDAGRRLVEELSENPRPLNDEENALLLHRQVEVQNEFDRAQEALQSATDEVQTADATARVNRASDDLLAIYNAGKAAGTEQGRGLATRKLLANEDFSLAKMVTQRRAANEGKPLNAQQDAEIKRLNKIIEETNRKLAEKEEREKIAEAKEEFKRLISESKKEAKETAKQGKGITDFLEDQAQKARDRIISRRGKLFSTVDPLNVAGLVDEAIIGASYIAKGIKSFSDWSTRMVSDFGERIQPYLKELFARSQQYHDASNKIFEVKPRPSAIKKAQDNAAKGGALSPQVIYDLAREKVNAGITELDPVIKAVQQDLLPIYPDVTERQIRDAFSGYGKITRPSQEEDRVKLRELKRLGQLTSALEDAQRKLAPLKSGPQRDKQTQKVRELQKEVQRVMREQGIETSSPEQQLASANTARATALRNQIEDIDKRLRTGVKPGKRPAVPDSSEVERLKAERDAMRALLDEIENPSKSPEQKQLERDKKAIQRRTKEIQDRIKRNDYGPKPKKTPLMDDEKASLLLENQKAKEQFWKGQLELKLKNRSIPRKIIGGVGESLNVSRAILTSADLSAVLRQGGFIAFGNPVRAAKSIIPMFRALRSEKNAFKVDQEIRNRNSFPLMQQAKLYIADESTTSLSRMEEQYMSRWASNIPVIRTIVGASQRAYITFLNKLRADSFDAMVATLAKDGAPTLEESRAIANFINVATGRGDLGKASQAATVLNTVFFAPRYVASRFQLLAGQPLYGGTQRTRKLVAKEYAKTLTGLATVFGLAALAGAELEDDPTSSDFGKIRFNNTRLDPLFGLLQVTVFLSREASALKRLASKWITGQKEKTPKYGSGGKVLARFLRSKASPVVGSAINLVEEKDIVGQPVTPESLAKGTLVPISLQEIGESMTDLGVPAGTVTTLLSLFGLGVQTYEDRKKK